MTSKGQPRDVWYRLVTSDGKPYDDASVDVLELPSSTDIARFLEAVRIRNGHFLAHAVACQFKVFKNKASLDRKRKEPEDKENKAPLDKKLKCNLKSQDKPLDPSYRLACLGTGPEPLIVVVPEKPEILVGTPWRPAMPWELQGGEFPRNIALPFQVPAMGVPLDDSVKSAQGSFATIMLKYHAKSGVTSSPNDVMLSCRRAFISEAAFLQHNAIQDNAVCWVVGPPGSGKSCAAFAFALSLDPSNWNVLWIHYDNDSKLFQCVRFEGNGKSTLSFAQVFAVDQIDCMLKAELANDNVKTIIIFDGYTRSQPVAEKAFRVCMKWRLDNIEQHHLVCIYSTVAFGRDCHPGMCPLLPTSDDTKYSDHQLWNSWSWLLDEFLVAVKNENFYESVKAILGGCSSQRTSQAALTDNSIGDLSRSHSQQMRQELVTSKFDITGGNARYMFRMTTDNVVAVLKWGVHLVFDVTPYIQGTVGQHVRGVVHYLLGMRLDERGHNKTALLSRFVGRELAIRFGPTMVLRFKEALSTQVNPARDCHLLEMWFFALLASAGVTLEIRGNENDTEWARSPFIDSLDPMKDKVGLVPNGQSTIWLRPIRWNHGGYDAVCLELTTGLVRFVQIARAERHSFDAKFFFDMLTKLSAEGMQVRLVELAYVVPIDNLDTFESLSIAEFNRDVVERFNHEISNQRPTAEGQVHVYGLSWDSDES